MQRTIGVNTWVWTSPLTDESLAELAPKIARMGFGAIELPLENAGDWDAGRTGDLLESLQRQPVVIGAIHERPAGSHRADHDGLQLQRLEQITGAAGIPIPRVLERQLDRPEAHARDLRCELGQGLVGQRRGPHPRVDADRALHCSPSPVWGVSSRSARSTTGRDAGR